jgi:hypothetical protein
VPEKFEQGVPCGNGSVYIAVQPESQKRIFGVMGVVGSASGQPGLDFSGTPCRSGICEFIERGNNAN